MGGAYQPSEDFSVRASPLVEMTRVILRLSFGIYVRT